MKEWCKKYLGWVGFGVWVAFTLIGLLGRFILKTAQNWSKKAKNDQKTFKMSQNWSKSEYFDLLKKWFFTEYLHFQHEACCVTL